MSSLGIFAFEDMSLTPEKGPVGELAEVLITPFDKKKINKLVKNVLQVPNCKADELFHLREVLHFLKDKPALAVDSKLQEIFQKGSFYKTDTCLYIEKHGWTRHWDNYTTFIALLSLTNSRDLSLLHSIHNQLCSLSFKERMVLEDIIFNTPQKDRLDHLMRRLAP